MDFKPEVSSYTLFSSANLRYDYPFHFNFLTTYRNIKPLNNIQRVHFRLGLNQFLGRYGGGTPPAADKRSRPNQDLAHLYVLLCY